MTTRDEKELHQDVAEPEQQVEASPSRRDNLNADVAEEVVNVSGEARDDTERESRLTTDRMASNSESQTQLQEPQRTGNRKGSFVSFKEKHELYEIDLEAGEGHRGPKKPAACVSLRYYIMLLALISPFVVTYSKTIINFAIIDMIHPDYLSQNQAINKPQQQEQSGPTSTSSMTLNSVLGIDEVTTGVINNSYFDLDNSCPVSEEDRERLLEDLRQDTMRAHNSPGEKFEWDTLKQGLLKAAYSIGHAFLQVAGGRLSEIYGSHWIMGISSLFIGASCLSAPFLAATHFYLIFADLLFLGILGSFMTPALVTLFSNWLTPSEKSMMISFYLVSSRLGYALSSLLCGFLIDAQLSWRYLFYSAGWVSLVFAFLSLLCSTSRPQDHPFMKQEELDYLASKNTLVREALNNAKMAELAAKNEAIEMKPGTNARQKGGPVEAQTGSGTINDQASFAKTTKKTGAPWFAILTNAPVWAFVITKFCVKLAGDTVQIELPTYLKRVMHFAPRDNGLLNASNYVIFCLSCILVGALAKNASKKQPFGWSKTTVRKVFQSVASFGVAIILLGVSFSVCHNRLTQILLMIMFFLTTFGSGGEAQIPLDISERYAGTIHAIGSSFAVSGAIEPILVGFLLRGHASDKDSWAAVWMGASAIACLGGLVFLIFGDATIQPFDALDIESNRCQPNQNSKQEGEQTSLKLNGSENKAFERDVNLKDDVGGKIVAHRESKQI